MSRRPTLTADTHLDRTSPTDDIEPCCSEVQQPHGGPCMQVIREDLGRVFESAVLLASTIFVTLPLTIPRLLNVQLAVPLAATEGVRGREAMRASKARMHGFRRTAALMLGLVRPAALPAAAAMSAPEPTFASGTTAQAKRCQQGPFQQACHSQPP